MVCMGGSALIRCGSSLTVSTDIQIYSLFSFPLFRGGGIPPKTLLYLPISSLGNNSFRTP